MSKKAKKPKVAAHPECERCAAAGACCETCRRYMAAGGDVAWLTARLRRMAVYRERAAGMRPMFGGKESR